MPNEKNRQKQAIPERIGFMRPVRNQGGNFVNVGNRDDFYKRMGIVCKAIPSGTVATYGQIAMLCGKPKNSRQVGYGLKHDLAGSCVPAFRVVNGRGELSGAAHFRIPGLQQELLRAEGVDVFWNGKAWCVDLKTYGWRTTTQDADAFQRLFEQIEK